MEWWLVLGIIFGSLIIAFLTGIPVAFAFLGLNIIGLVLLTGGTVGLTLIIGSVFDSVTTFTLIAIPMFFLMGEVLFHSRVIDMVMEATDKWIGRVRARLLFVSLGAGTGLATLSGAGMADTALIASTLYPDMEGRGYDPRLSIGVITSSGLLAAIIPPSALAVLLASLASVSAGRLLIAGLIPGLMIAGIYAVYIAVRAYLNPSLAPSYPYESVTWMERIVLAAKLLPLGVVIFSVMGFIILGIATPSEAAATGALAAIVVTALYRRLNLKVLANSVMGVVRIATMILLIVAGAKGFGQVLAMTGATQGLLEFVTGLDVSPIVLLLLIQLAVIILGLFVDPVAIMLITIPIVAPLIPAFGWDPIWFYILFLINIVIGNESPPFGLTLFVVKGVLPHISIGTIFRAQIPFIIMDAAAMGILILFPQIVLWLPNRVLN